MNALTTTDAPEDQLMRVLQNSLYPGAKPESIALVLAYCKVQGIDPMLKPVHIVPTSVKVGHDKYEWRDVLMPGIADYRIKAARSGEYGGKSEPEFGPEVTERVGDKSVTYPAWCRITVRRIVQGHAREFTATERWLENYATAGSKTETPNRMWLKRPYGQLAKCAEAQALRMGFPEFSGGYTAEEMEGKPGFTGQTLEHTDEPEPDERDALNDAIPMPKQVPLNKAAAAATPRAPRVAEKTEAPQRTEEAWRVWVDKLRQACAVLYSRQEVVEIGERASVTDAIATGPGWVRAEVSKILAENYARFGEEPEAEEPTELEIVNADKLAG